MDFALLTLGDTGWGDELLRGLVTTVALAVLSYLLGIVLGLIGAFGKLSGRRGIRLLAESYTTVVRGIPTLVLVFIIFFGLEAAIGSALDAFGYTGQVFLDAFTMGVIAIGLLSGAYSTEAIRGALVAIPVGQIEAARAFGMPPRLIFRRITLPLLSPTMLVVLVLALIRSVQTFDEVFAFTGGGPGTATTFIIQYIYEEGFAGAPRLFGLAAAASLMVAGVLVVLTLVQLWVNRRNVNG